MSMVILNDNERWLRSSTDYLAFRRQCRPFPIEFEHLPAALSGKECHAFTQQGFAVPKVRMYHERCNVAIEVSYDVFEVVSQNIVDGLYIRECGW